MKPTNFEHLRKYRNGFFEMAIRAEEQILMAYALERVKTKSPMDIMIIRKNAGNLMRQVAEGLTERVGALYGINVVKSRQFDNINEMAKSDLFKEETINNLHKIRMIGNKCSHPDGVVSGKEIQEMYELFYRETYKMVTFYLDMKNVDLYLKDWKQKHEEKKRAEKVAWGIALGVIGIFVLLMML